MRRRRRRLAGDDAPSSPRLRTASRSPPTRAPPYRARGSDPRIRTRTSRARDRRDRTRPRLSRDDGFDDSSMVSLEVERPLIERARGERHETHRARRDALVRSTRSRSRSRSRSRARSASRMARRSFARSDDDASSVAARPHRASHVRARERDPLHVRPCVARESSARDARRSRARFRAGRGSHSARRDGERRPRPRARRADARVRRGRSRSSPFAAAVFPSAVFAQREASVRVHGLNFCRAGTGRARIVTREAPRRRGARSEERGITVRRRRFRIPTRRRTRAR